MAEIIRELALPFVSLFVAMDQVGNLTAFWRKTTDY
jgi:hypothetical protein